jgi:hypothetical protein
MSTVRITPPAFPEGHSGPIPVEKIDIRGLERERKASIEGEVRFDRGSLEMYAVDASNYRQVPIGVVIPEVWTM